MRCTFSLSGTLHRVERVIASFCPARAAQERGQSQSPCAQVLRSQTHSQHIARLWDVVLYFLQKHVASRHGSSSARAATCRGAMASPSGPGPAVARVAQRLIPRTERVPAGSLLPISYYSIEKCGSSGIGVAQMCAVTKGPHVPPSGRENQIASFRNTSSGSGALRARKICTGGFAGCCMSLSTMRAAHAGAGRSMRNLATYRSYLYKVPISLQHDGELVVVERGSRCYCRPFGRSIWSSQRTAVS